MAATATAPEMVQFSVADLEHIIHTMKEANTSFISLEEIQRMRNTFPPTTFVGVGVEKIGPFSSLPSDASSAPLFTNNTVPTVTTVPTFRFDAGLDFNIKKSSRSRKNGHASPIKTGGYFSATDGETYSVGNGTSFIGQNQNFNPNNINVSSSTAFPTAAGSNSNASGGWFWGGAVTTNNETAISATDNGEY